ncbi:hypothetical protein ASZ90_011055 [hydrocarbon metagenome]|uniref:Uncharacterized protein n=1 Tax=hydrocarbon metagenome TaxID=938273 RepID=A0A0W8FED8_9ZZZZ
MNLSNLAGIFLLFGIGYFRALERNLFSKVLFGIGSSRSLRLRRAASSAGRGVRD